FVIVKNILGTHTRPLNHFKLLQFWNSRISKENKKLPPIISKTKIQKRDAQLEIKTNAKRT
ncbi:hypothetical protein BLA29_011801, partial [Euroglyphus maynei]